MLAIHFKQAINNIRQHVLRSLLTLLGVLVGTCAVVTLLTGGELATRAALEQFKKVGVEFLGMSLVNNYHNKSVSNGFELSQAKYFLSSNIADLVPYTLHFSTIIFKNQNVESILIGSNDDLQKFIQYKLNAGRFITTLDKDSFYCVLGNDIAKTLSRRSGDLIGQQITINNFIFTIVGIIEPSDRNLFLLADSNQAIFIPIMTSINIYKNTEINQFIFKIKPQKDIQEIEDELRIKFKLILPGSEINFHSPEDLVKNMQEQQRIFKWLLGMIGSITLLVGGIGVMNIMLVSVTERRQEIGIRIAVGARKRDIRSLFLIEAAIQTLLGGLGGIFLGELASFIFSLFFKWPFHIIWQPIFIGFSVSLLVGIFFGFYPAKRASMLNPIDILRS
jgi:putative ABC transport system permease protein